MGKVAYERGYREIVTITWDYAGGKEDVEGFEDAFTEAGGEIDAVQLRHPVLNKKGLSGAALKGQGMRQRGGA